LIVNSQHAVRLADSIPSQNASSEQQTHCWGSWGHWHWL